LANNEGNELKARSTLRY